MIHTLYVEASIRGHPRAKKILARFPKAIVIECGRYGEVFNPKPQNFRIQKRNPALILAQKFGNFVLEAPEGFGIGGSHNYYFSHMLNCIYDCRYCFLQGMYRSAHYVLFVNYEEFQAAIEEILNDHPGKQPLYFFSGYDCDSLAMESVTGFVHEFLPFFRGHPRAILELRTKSIAIGALLKVEPISNCVVAFSFTPQPISGKVEHGVPTVKRRIEAMVKLAEAGWQLGLRFDPLIYHQHYQENYQELFNQIFNQIPSESIHSISTGPLRFPKKMFETIARLYPDEKLFAGRLTNQNGLVSYRRELEAEMTGFCRSWLKELAEETKLFSCTPY